MKEPVNIDTIIVEHLDFLYRLALRLTGCKQTAEDIVQDLFVNLKPQDANVDYVKNKKAWLGTILYRTFVKHWRKEKRSPFTVVVDNRPTDNFGCTQEHLACDQPGPEEQASSAKLQSTLHHALNKLSEEYRIVVIMHDVEGYTLQELHQIMNVPIGTLKSRLHRARNKLHTFLLHKQSAIHTTPTLEKWLAHEL